ncbi:hypothetical protein [Stenoxybacter acetivorans]|uniref:hypothetical protein n=1 Tax=Stenoxybacter acetivorans TaxID=422441 RepID=UPI001FE0B56E|nr:hypothetical protein [Stenoxybacter acetivorans]
MKPIEKAVLPPVSAELLADYPKPAPPKSGEAAVILEHAADYGAWCLKRDSQVNGWQQWYQTGAQ